MSEPKPKNKTYTEIIEKLQWTPAGDPTDGQNPCPSCTFKKPGNELIGDIELGLMNQTSFPVRDVAFEFLDVNDRRVKLVGVNFPDRTGDLGDSIHLSGLLTSAEKILVKRVVIHSTGNGGTTHAATIKLEPPA